MTSQMTAYVLANARRNQVIAGTSLRVLRTLGAAGTGPTPRR